MRNQVIDIVPVPYTRMTQRDQWKPRHKRYKKYKDDLRWLWDGAFPCEMTFRFCLPMPNSWSEKRKRESEGKPHQSRPDLDNLVKGVLDALLDEDSLVWRFSAEKIWGYEGRIEIYYE